MCVHIITYSCIRYTASREREVLLKCTTNKMWPASGHWDYTRTQECPCNEDTFRTFTAVFAQLAFWVGSVSYVEQHHHLDP